MKEKYITGPVLLFFVSFFICCQKVNDVYYSISSPEYKLVKGDWHLSSVSKDGTIIHSLTVAPICGMQGSPNGTSANIVFLDGGEIKAFCDILTPLKSSYMYGIWKVNKKKSIEITYLDSCYWDYTNQTTIYYPIDPLEVKWEIDNISGILKVKEVRTDGNYEFIFYNHE